MANKKSSPGQVELNLFPDGLENLIQTNSSQEEPLLGDDDCQDDSGLLKKAKIKAKDTSNIQNNIDTISCAETDDDLDLFLPLTYEDLLKEIGEGKSKLPDLIVPVTEFEGQIVQVLADIKNAGYLLFLYGVSGVGKSTFISSLQFRKHIRIQQIVPIDASELSQLSDSLSKLKELIKQIKQEAIHFSSNNNTTNDKLCIVIDYLENLEDENNNDVRAFFRDLNGLLRKHPILIIWPVTVMKDLENMQSFAKSYSSTMFHRRIPVIKFTGPPIEEYPNIAKKTIMFFNKGKSCYEFQLNDNDFEQLKNDYKQKPQDKHLIREYLRNVRELWEKRTNHISKIVQSIPKPTEVWFIFSYPNAEGTVARFAKQTPDIINEMWNADHRSLYAYISENNQRKADWPVNRLSLALSGQILTTKIMYLPTNALVSCISAYAKDAKVPISKEDLLAEDKYNISRFWFQKGTVQKTLKTTPLYLQLAGIPITGGKRKSGTVKTGLNNAQQAFEKINSDISNSRISDRHFNKSICLSLQDAFQGSRLVFSCEIEHPHLTNIRPDILVDMNEKIVCLEFCYTNNNTPGNMADYVLRKLNIYMKQLQYNFGIEHFNW
jgi:hypothetical protein